jgi:drug/metabolite transporter (DMT)-like permease
MNGAAAFGGKVFGSAYVLLILTTLFWGGNTIAGRLAVGEVSPMMVVTLRWIIVSSVMLVLVWPRFLAEWSLIRKHLWQLAAMAVTGFTAFNSLFYIAAHSTTAVNLGIIQGSMPIFVLIGAVLFFGTNLRSLQVVGILATLVGVVLVASQGSWEILKDLSINPGDGIMLIACLLYSGYTLALRNRPKISGLVFFTALSIIAAISSVPGIVYEYSTGNVQWPTFNGWLVVLYISIFPSCLSQLFFMRGVELIGPARAGVFMNLVPIWAPLLAVGILGEPFRWHHGLALLLILGGIWLSERKSNGG